MIKLLKFIRKYLFRHINTYRITDGNINIQHTNIKLYHPDNFLTYIAITKFQPQAEEYALG